MKLKHLKHEVCPTCEARLRSAAYTGTHCNGEDFERVDFECGMSIEYVPNFSKEQVRALCRHSTVYKQAMAKFQDARQAIMAEAARRLDDEQFESFDKQMRYWRWEPSIPR